MHEREIRGRRLRPAMVVATAVFAATVASAAIAAPAPVETGLHTLHPAARIGGKLCFVEHEHIGDGLAMPSRHVAEASAVRQWVTFTVFEYGTAWGNYAAAVGKKMSCTQNADRHWACNVLARPCRSRK